MPRARGIFKDARALLDALHGRFSGPFSVAQAATLWAMDQRGARRRLAHPPAQGWLSRVRRDAYVTAPLGATAPSEWRADPWVVATTVFEPCHLAGWTACEHWGLTEQIFRSMWIVTARRVSPPVQGIQGITDNIKVTSPDRLFGVTRDAGLRELRRLVDEGFLVLEGERRGARYLPGPRLGVA